MDSIALLGCGKTGRVGQDVENVHDMLLRDKTDGALDL